MSAAHLLTRTVSDRHISRVEAAGRTEGQDGAAGKTLGDLLYTNKELHPTDDLEATAILSPEESVHLAECPKCVDLFVETVREKVRRRQDESPPET